MRTSPSPTNNERKRRLSTKASFFSTFAVIAMTCLVWFGILSLLRVHESESSIFWEQMGSRMVAAKVVCDTPSAPSLALQSADPITRPAQGQSFLVDKEAAIEEENTQSDNLFEEAQGYNSNNYSYPQYPPYDLYHDAWYIDEVAEYNTTSHIYQDEHILELMANDTYVPYNLYRDPKNRSRSVLDAAGTTHKVLTALREVKSREEFFNPVCFQYRFPNISLFPTMSVIVPMQNGMYIWKQQYSRSVCFCSSHRLMSQNDRVSWP